MAIANEFLQLLTFKTSGTAGRESAKRNCTAGAHQNGRFTRDITGDGAAEFAALADNIFAHFELTFENDEETRLLAFAYEPFARCKVNVSRTSREAPPFLLFYNTKNSGFLKILR